jgi:hypothetical protein
LQNFSEHTMENELIASKKSSLTILELKRLLFELKEKRPDICIRYRLMGELWKKNFMRITSIVENSLVVEDEQARIILGVPNIANIIQLELDNTFQHYQAHFHYDVVLDQ